MTSSKRPAVRARMGRVTRSASVITLFLVLATCSSLDDLEIEATGTTTIPQGTVVDQLLGQLSFAGFEGLDLSQSQSFRNQGYTKDDIDSVHIVSFTLAITAPEGGSFDFLERIAFSIEAEDLPPLEIARLDPIPQGQSEIELQVDSSLELLPYVVAPSLTITTQATGTRPAEETTVDALVVFGVDVNVTGSCS